MTQQKIQSIPITIQVLSRFSLPTEKNQGSCLLGPCEQGDLQTCVIGASIISFSLHVLCANTCHECPSGEHIYNWHTGNTWEYSYPGQDIFIWTSTGEFAFIIGNSDFDPKDSSPGDSAVYASGHISPNLFLYIFQRRIGRGCDRNQDRLASWLLFLVRYPSSNWLDSHKLSYD